MKLTDATAPGREIVMAYTLTFGDESGKLVVADLERLVEEMAENKCDKAGRVDPMKVVATDAMREMVARINSMRTMSANPVWQDIDRRRQLAAAKQKDTAR